MLGSLLTLLEGGAHVHTVLGHPAPMPVGTGTEMREKDTTINEIEDTFRQFLNRDDIGIILINQYIAEMVRHALDAHQRSIPAVLEIPSKEHPYDAAKDSILRRAKGMFTAEDLR